MGNIRERTMKTYHLKPDGDDWMLMEDGVERPLAAFSSKRVALNAARDLTDQRKVRLVVFRDDGTVEEVREPAKSSGMQ
jgi:hypothetical protein